MWNEQFRDKPVEYLIEKRIQRASDCFRSIEKLNPKGMHLVWVNFAGRVDRATKEIFEIIEARDLAEQFGVRL